MSCSFLATVPVRGVTGTGDISSYATIDAVYNLFNYSEGLQNPELVIRRLLAGDELARQWFDARFTACCVRQPKRRTFV